MRRVFRPVGTCSTEITVTVEGDVVKELRFADGCRGNLEALGRLAIGSRVDELVTLLQGIVCQNGTSCPDQLARVLSTCRGSDSATC